MFNFFFMVHIIKLISKYRTMSKSCTDVIFFLLKITLFKHCKKIWVTDVWY